MWFNFDSMLRASSPALNIRSRASHSIPSIILPSSSPSICSRFVHLPIVHFSRHFSRPLAVNILDITSSCLTVHYLDISLNVSKWIISIFCPAFYDEYSYSTTNKMRLLCQIIYSCTTLYMFRSFRPSSAAQKLHIQQRYMSNSCCYLLLSVMRCNIKWWIFSIFYRMSETEFSRFFFCTGTSRVALNNLKFPYDECQGHAVALLVEALHCKSEGHGFDSRWCHWIFSFTQSFRPHYGPGVHSASNRNEYQECFLGVKVAGA